MNRFTRAAALSVTILALAACGSNEAGGSDSGTSEGAAQAADKTYPGKTAQQIMDASRAAVTKTTSVKIHGKSGGEGQSIVFDMARDDTKGMVGEVTINGAPLKLRQIGDITYAQASTQFLATLGPMGTSMSSVLGTKWLMADPNSLAAIASSTGDGVMNAFTTYETAASTLNASVPPGAKLQRVAGKPVDGVQTTGIAFSAPMPPEAAAAISSSGGQPPATLTGTVYIAATGTPYPVAIQSNGGVDITLSGWGKPVKLVAPSKKQTVSLSQLGLPGL
jgi:hypothetical protein